MPHALPNIGTHLRSVMLAAVATLPGSANPCRRAARFGFAPNTASSSGGSSPAPCPTITPGRHADPSGQRCPGSPQASDRFGQLEPRPAALTRMPQSPQNFSSGSLGKPQSGQGVGRGAPDAAQNRRPLRFSAWHRVHGTGRIPVLPGCEAPAPDAAPAGSSSAIARPRARAGAAAGAPGRTGRTARRAWRRPAAPDRRW